MAEAKKSYKQLRAELDTVIEVLQSEDLDVDDAIKQYEHGLTLIKDLEKYLQASENKLRKLKVDLKQPPLA